VIELIEGQIVNRAGEAEMTVEGGSIAPAHRFLYPGLR